MINLLLLIAAEITEILGEIFLEYDPALEPPDWRE
jgi:hypothetical protein